MNGDALPQLMVKMAQRSALPELLGAVTAGIAECENVVLARLWLIGPGDVCSDCHFKTECPDQSRCLHLVASSGNPRAAKLDYSHIEGRFRRFPIGVRKIGHIAASGEPLLLPDLRGDEDWIADHAWTHAEGVRTFAGRPLKFRGEVLGVLAIFDRQVLTTVDFEWLRVFADHAAVSIANARAFEEIAQLRARLEEENNYLREEVSSVWGTTDLIGESPVLRKMQHQVQLVAPTTAAVLISGESGTGKELVARAIHERSPRKERPLIKVNCSAVPESLFESEFFGHVRGAFTGALKDKLGRFELADGGTLFLDEIGEIPLAMQPKLLRVLQEGELERVGDPRTRKIDVRIIAATNRDLRKEVAAGRFRQDLFYRLSVFPIEVPPLRERIEDIPRLVQHFAQHMAKEHNRPAPRLTPAVLQQFAQHDWPGNVRELENAVERSMILAQSGPLRFDLPESSVAVKAPSSKAAAEVLPRSRAELKQQERAMIEDALRECRGRIFGPSGAAAQLGMRPTTLASRIKTLGIQRKR
jgi:transcriptional regulator with GAF, ATPase, and Fis domain